MTSYEGLILALEILAGLAGLAGWLALSVIVWWLLTWRARRDRRESLNRHDGICERLGLPRRRK